MAGVQDKVVLITGGARGIGAATAEALATKGAKLVLVDVDQPPLDEVVARIGTDRAIGIVGDVTSLESMEAAVAAGVAKFGGIDVAVANAGIATYGSVLQVD